MDQDKTKAAKNRGKKKKKTELSYVLSVVFAAVAANCSCSLFSSCGELH
jgi:hypothetical protein